MAEDNKRNQLRKKTVYYFDIYDWKTDELMGHAVDITTEGMMLVSKEEIKEDSDFQLRMSFPFEMEGIKEITFDAKSKWSGKDVNPDYYDTGFVFTEMSPEDKGMIEILIESYTFRD